MLRLIAVIAIAFITTPAIAQSADELLAKNIEAKGDRAGIEAIQSVRQQGMAHSMGMKLPLVIYSKRPNMMRSEVEVQGDLMITAFDGETAWTINPAAEGPQKLPDDQIGQIREQADIDGILVNYADHGYALEYAGEGQVKGEKAFKLKLTSQSGEETLIYLDADTYLEAKVEREVDNPMMGGRVKVETFMSDYRKVGGVQMPFHLESYMNGQPFQQIVIEKIEVNEELPDDLFAFPGEGE